MAKRQAEKQLTDRNWRDEEGDEAPISGPMRTASPQVLQKRQIRALPNKAGLSAPKTNPNFAKGFAISSPSSNSSPFSPLPHSSQSVNLAANPFNTFNGASSTGSPFGSLTNPSNLFAGLQASQPTPSPNRSSLDDNQSIKPTSNLHLGSQSKKSNEPLSSEAMTTYYASLRGLNLSVAQALEGLMEKDPFVNLSSTFDCLKTNYLKHREEIVKELRQSQAIAAQQGASLSTAPLNPTSPASPLTSSARDSSNSSNYLSFAPSPGGQAAKNSASAKSSPFAAAFLSKPSPLRFETNPITHPESAPQTSEQSDQTSTKSPPVPSVAKVAPTFTNLDPPGSSSSSLSVSSASLKPLFGNSSFGASTNPTTPPSTLTANANVNTPPKSVIGFGFGMNPGNNKINGSLFGGGFGLTKTTTESSQLKNGFNPVGFSFGTSPPTSLESSAFSSKVAATADTSSADNPPPASSTGNTAGLTTQGPTNRCTESTTDDSFPSATESSIRDTNEGEEDEDTLFEMNARIYTFTDADQADGNKQKRWIGWAVGKVKINQNKQTKRSRILARSETNKRILINFLIRADMKPKLIEPSVEFLGFNETAPQLYRVRPSTTQLGEEFLQAFQKVVDSMK
ncbi:hypothetical protein O181_033461 [Austropuccinia psidii MF-1]|uniref:RanBD1 domain-containing protein n=1 Tax=Austropuccinia psidii MF-1 TaxID=1389203 RepID=A0A9Q3D4H0_9BASI|nr:hypothetical protein [Austropuccinia psidii MF-1]